MTQPKTIQHPQTKKSATSTIETPTYEQSEVLLDEATRPVEEQDVITKSIETVNRANEASVLMALLCNTLNLVPYKTTHVELVQRFTELQNQSLEAQKFLQEKFVTVPVPEKRRKNKKMNYM